MLLKHGSGAFGMELHNYNLLMSFIMHGNVSQHSHNLKQSPPECKSELLWIQPCPQLHSIQWNEKMIMNHNSAEIRKSKLPYILKVRTWNLELEESMKSFKWPAKIWTEKFQFKIYWALSKWMWKIQARYSLVSHINRRTQIDSVYWGRGVFEPERDHKKVQKIA